MKALRRQIIVKVKAIFMKVHTDSIIQGIPPLGPKYIGNVIVCFSSHESHRAAYSAQS